MAARAPPLPGRSAPAPTPSPHPAPSQSNGNADPEHDAQSLRRVYGEMRSKYQRYRKETGKSSVPALRDAVVAFKKGPSLTSLVGVATFLDERGLLPW